LSHSHSSEPQTLLHKHQHGAHGHSHVHISADMSSTRIAWAFVLNVCFTIIEFIGGYLTNSTAIMADAVHDLGDSLAIGFAWLLNKLSQKHANDHFTYGYQRFSLLAALINGVVLIVGSIWVLTEAIPRLAQPEMPHAQGMLGLALLGIVVNGYAAFKLSDGKTLNERVLNWHLMEDVLGWVAVLIVAIVLMFVQLPILDPILSIGFTLFILFNVLKNLQVSVRLFLQAVPDKQLHNDILKQLIDLQHVEDIHHFHLWSLDGEHHVLSAHFVLAQQIDFDTQASIKAELAKRLKSFNLAHTTIEFELADETCRDAKHPHHGHE
jgi:cobalt-zinc-cadmium efflux system protein